MVVSRLFRDMIFVRTLRSQLNGFYEEIHINSTSCDLTFWDP